MDLKKFGDFLKELRKEKGLTQEELAETLWTAWKHGRNKVFHYFPGETENIKKEEAIDKINGLLQAIVTAGKFLKDNQNYKY